MDLVIEVERLDAASQALRYFALKSRVCVNDVPVPGHELCSSGSHSEVPEDPIQSACEEEIHKTEIEAEEEDRDNYNNRGSSDFLPARPGNLLHFTPHVGVKLLGVIDPIFC